MEMFALSYVTGYVFTPDSVFKSVLPKGSEPTWNLPFFKIHVNPFMAWDDSPGAKIISKCVLWVGGLVPFSEFWDISFL